MLARLQAADFCAERPYLLLLNELAVRAVVHQFGTHGIELALQAPHNRFV
jgi:hypothetical protein